METEPKTVKPYNAAKPGDPTYQLAEPFRPVNDPPETEYTVVFEKVPEKFFLKKLFNLFKRQV